MEPSAPRCVLRVELPTRRSEPDVVRSGSVPATRPVATRPRHGTNRLGLGVHRRRREAVSSSRSRNLRSRRDLDYRQRHRRPRDLVTIRLVAVERISTLLGGLVKRSGPIQRKTPLRRVSTKTAKRNRARSTFRLEQLAERPGCEARETIWTIEPTWDGCTRFATDLHEPLTRARGGSVLDASNTVATCRACHEWIHRYPTKATQIGLLQSAAAGPSPTSTMS